MENIKQNNLSPNLKHQLDDVGYYLRPTGYSSSGTRGFSVEVPIERADVIIVSNKDSFETFSIKTPNKKEITIDYILSAIAKKDSATKAFVNLSNYMSTILKKYNISAYPTSYGIGVLNIYNKMKDYEKTQIMRIMDDLGLNYTTELSDGEWVLRFKVSKNKNNIEILNKV